MATAEGSNTFQASGDAYDQFMGRYAIKLAPLFADFIGIDSAAALLDVGCGPGALSGEAISRGARVSAVDPSPGFVQEYRTRHPGITVEQGPAENLPFADHSFDIAAAQLVFHFVSDPPRAVAEMSRVVRPGGIVAGCVWDLAQGMELLRTFWDAALTVLPDAPDETGVERFGGAGELADLFTRSGLLDVTQAELRVTRDYASYDELWQSFQHGVGPVGAYVATLSAADLDRLQGALFVRLGRPAGSFTLTGLAHAARGRTPA
ncbi:class I SAM-dependent methyltransferase [Calidifontibacter terrae]